MRTREEAVAQFVYHPATAESALKHAKLRDTFVAMVHTLWDLTPDGPEKTLMFRKLQEASMYGNLAIALGVPADVTETRSVARVLPTAPRVVALSELLGPTVNQPAAEQEDRCGYGCDCS